MGGYQRKSEIYLDFWTFAECQKAFGWDIENYIRFGGYPGAALYIQDKQRWRQYILDSIIEPVLSKDILGLHPVNKPALFRQTFELAVQFPAKIISLQKLLGQLQDRGNAATIKHYLDLLEKSFLIKTLQKYSGSIIKTKNSSPKIIVLNPALTNAYQAQERLKQDLDWHGDCFESIVGAHLNHIPGSELYYWCDGNLEVNFVLKTLSKVYALEIKSGTRKSRTKGLRAFSKRYPKVLCETWDSEKCLDFLTNQGSLEDCFKMGKV